MTCHFSSAVRYTDSRKVAQRRHRESLLDMYAFSGGASMVFASWSDDGKWNCPRDNTNSNKKEFVAWSF